MTGSQAEQSLLGALLVDPKVLVFFEGLVSGSDFADARQGEIFTRLVDAIHRGRPIVVEEIGELLHEWDVRGLEEGSWFWWIDPDRCRPYAAPGYARTVRSDAVKRHVKTTMSAAAERLADGWSGLDIASKALTELQDVVDGSSSGQLATKTLTEILNGSDEYDWLIPNILERRDRLVVTGPEGSGKTTWVRQLAVLSAAGVHPIEFTPMLPVRVLVVDAENTERQWRRAVRWMTREAAKVGAVDPGPLVHIVAGHRIDITRGSHLAEIHRLIDVHKPDVVFIGPLYKLVPRAITNDDDAAPLIVALDGIRERDVALVMEAHAGKSAGTDGHRDLRPRGSAALLGWPEFGLGLRPDPEQPNDVEVIRWRGDRDTRSWPRRMTRGLDWPWQPTL